MTEPLPTALTNSLPTLSATIASPALGGTTVEVLRFSQREAVDEPYELRLELGLTDPDFEVSLLLGAPITVSLARGETTRDVHGIVREVGEPSAWRDEATRFVVGVVPALALLSLRRNTRIFQGKTVPEIVETVLEEGLGPYDRSFELQLDAAYPTREYCVQYQESDLDFVHRLLEEEGIGYSFDHEGSAETLILWDTSPSLRELDAPLSYQPVERQVANEHEVRRFRLARTTVTTSVVVRDWDWTRAGDTKVEAEARSQDSLGRDREVYEFGQGRSLTLSSYANPSYGAEDSGPQSTVRQQARLRQAVRGQGVSGVVRLAPGMIFELTDHPHGLDGRYLVTRVEHRSEPMHAAIGVGQGTNESYHNRFECVPADVPWRPVRRTPKPRIPGLQTAIVTGPAGEEIHVDEHGRIKVRFGWDRESPFDDTSSCWVRVEQPWAGAGWGYWFVPRIGMEVVVMFVDGDPDRPLVSGSVYNGANVLPYPLPDEKTKSTIKTHSSPGGGGYNEIRFEDKAGSEEIFTHAQKDYDEVVLNDHNTSVGHNQTNEVDLDQTQTVHGDQTEQVDGNQDMTVDGNRSVHVEGSYDETVDGAEERHVAGDVSETFAANETRSVGGNLTESIGGSETRSLGAAQTETISGSQAVTIGAAATHTISGALTQTVVGGITQTIAAAQSHTVSGAYTMIAPPGLTITAAGGMDISAPGGVTQIDGSDAWLGGWKTSRKLQDSATCVFKIEAMGVNLALVDLKMEYAQNKAETVAIQIEAHGSGLLNFAAYVKNHAIRGELKPSCQA
jgi:type VI secretion system secreted protein VgrG